MQQYLGHVCQADCIDFQPHGPLISSQKSFISIALQFNCQESSKSEILTAHWWEVLTMADDSRNILVASLLSHDPNVKPTAGPICYNCFHGFDSLKTMENYP